MKLKKVWAFIGEDGWVLADSSFEDDHHAWTIALGHPTRGEVKRRQDLGARVKQVLIVIPGDGDST